MLFEKRLLFAVFFSHAEIFSYENENEPKHAQIDCAIEVPKLKC